MSEVIDLISICHLCKREIKDGDIYLTHPKHGIVCEYCPEFADGGVEAKGEGDDQR